MTETSPITLTPAPKPVTVGPLPESDIIPLFSSHSSLEGASVLTLEEAGKTTPGEPVSICDLAKVHSLKQVVVVDDKSGHNIYECHDDAMSDMMRILIRMNEIPDIPQSISHIGVLFWGEDEDLICQP